MRSNPPSYRGPRTTHDQHIKTLIKSLPEEWAAHNDCGLLVTKRQLLHNVLGELKESDSLQAFEQAILTTLPPSTTMITQYTTHFTSDICMDNTVRRHTIQNACQDQVMSHTLFNPITIFNIHNNAHFTALVTNNHTYYYYESLNFRPPHGINKIHNTLRQWYLGLEVAPTLLRQDTPNTHIQCTPQQTDS